MKKTMLKIAACLCLAAALCGCVQEIDDKGHFQPEPEKPPVLPKTPVDLRVNYFVKKATISWDLVDENDKVEGYMVYRSTSKGGPYEKVDDKRIWGKNTYNDGVFGWERDKSITCTIQGIPIKTTYYYKVSVYRLHWNEELATYDAIESELSVPVEITIPDLRYPPDRVTVELESPDCARVTWSAAYDSDSDEIYHDVQYNVYRNAELVGTTSELFYEETGLALGTVHEYTIATITAVSLGDLSQKSYCVSVLTRPAKPDINVKISYSGSKAGLLVSWNKLTCTDSYKVYRSTDEDGPYTVLDEPGETITSYTDDTFTRSTKYYYKVSGVNKTDEGELSECADMLLWPSSLSPGSIGAVFHSEYKDYMSGDYIKVSWSECLTATEYRLYRSTSRTGDYTDYDTVSPPDSCTYTDYNIKAGTRHYYKVTAVIDGYETERTTFHTEALTRPEAPDYISIRPFTLIVNGKGVEVSWNRVEGATGYKVYCSDGSVVTTPYTSHIDSFMSLFATYYYWVRAYNDAGDSPPSASVYSN